MFITLASGKELRFHFVHSFTGKRNDARPGSLRQLVDNLALSLHRRVSFCEISEVAKPAMNDETGAPVQVFAPIGQGYAVCHWTDMFDKLSGRAHTLDRALRSTNLTADEVDAVWHRFPKEYQRLVELTGKF